MHSCPNQPTKQYVPPCGRERRRRVQAGPAPCGHSLEVATTMTHERIVFGGLTAPQEVPKAYKRLQRRHGATMEDYTLLDVLDRLKEEYNVEWRDLFHYDDGGNPSNVDDYRALVNPAWEGVDEEELPEGRTDAVWSIPTRSYARVPHHEVWRPLASAIKRRGDDEHVFGVARLQNDGGEVHLDVFVDHASVEGTGEESESVTLGISTGQDYLGNTRLYVDAVGYHDPGDGVGQIMRGLTDAWRRKHTGNAGQEVVEWYSAALDRLDDVSETLYQVVAESMNYDVPLSDIPGSLSNFYSQLGLPNKAPHNLADDAAERAVTMASGSDYTAYHLYKAGMWALEHQYEPRDTQRFADHVESVNTLLFNPALAERRVLKAVEEQIRTADENSDVYDWIEGEEPEVTIDTVRTRAESISEGVEEFQSTREKLRTMLEDEGVEVAEGDA